MGHACTKRNVVLVLSALETILRDAGHTIEPGAALAAATQTEAAVLS